MDTVHKPGVPRVLVAAKRSVVLCHGDKPCDKNQDGERTMAGEPGPWDQGHWANRK